MKFSAIWRRGAAAMIDGFILAVLSTLLGRLYLFPLSIILHLIYKPVFESSNVRATPGKFLAEISVVKENGDQLDLKTAYVRYFASWLSFFIFMIGYLAAFFNPKKQTLHDKFAGTVVIDQVYENNGLWDDWLAQFKVLIEFLKNFIAKLRSK